MVLKKVQWRKLVRLSRPFNVQRRGPLGARNGADFVLHACTINSCDMCCMSCLLFIGHFRSSLFLSLSLTLTLTRSLSLLYSTLLYSTLLYSTLLLVFTFLWNHLKASFFSRIISFSLCPSSQSSFSYPLLRWKQQWLPQSVNPLLLPWKQQRLPQSLNPHQVPRSTSLRLPQTENLQKMAKAASTSVRCLLSTVKWLVCIFCRVSYWSEP